MSLNSTCRRGGGGGLWYGAESGHMFRRGGAPIRGWFPAASCTRLARCRPTSRGARAAARSWPPCGAGGWPDVGAAARAADIACSGAVRHCPASRRVARWHDRSAAQASAGVLTRCERESRSRAGVVLARCRLRRCGRGAGDGGPPLTVKSARKEPERTRPLKEKTLCASSQLGDDACERRRGSGRQGRDSVARAHRGAFAEQAQWTFGIPKDGGPFGRIFGF